jgi:sugar (pentulose or hexulose) kinase
MHHYVIGVDIGTSGVRIMALRRDGLVSAKAQTPLPVPKSINERREQDPGLWWSAVTDGLDHLRRDLIGQKIDTKQVVAICVDATSGTVVPVDRHLGPLMPAIMYNDARAGQQAEALNRLAAPVLADLGFRFNASFSLAKLLWLKEHEPRIMDQARWLLHQADFITARLMNPPGRAEQVLTDESNALKSGYDILNRRWPDYLAGLGVDMDRLPPVRPIGATLGHLDTQMTRRFDFSTDCIVVAGMTDGTAACAASGARKVGDMNTTLGTTMVWKMISVDPIRDPKGRLYSHRHPGGAFLPGGAGNAGGAGIRATIPRDLELDSLVLSLDPETCTGLLTYPLPSAGERYPFVDRDFAPFKAVTNDVRCLYQSCLEGLVCIERWGYEVAEQLGADCGGDVWTTGQGARLDKWMQLRANFLNRPVCCSAHPESAYGAALVAAMNVWFNGSWEMTVNQMAQKARRFDPDHQASAAAQIQYEQFRDVCVHRIKKPHRNQEAI